MIQRFLRTLLIIGLSVGFVILGAQNAATANVTADNYFSPIAAGTYFDMSALSDDSSMIRFDPVSGRVKAPGALDSFLQPGAAQASVLDRLRLDRVHRCRQL